jgi:hypothetical protein
LVFLVFPPQPSSLPTKRNCAKPARIYRLSGATLSPEIDIHTTLTNLQVALKFVSPFIIREGAFCSNKVENLLVVIIVINVTPNQLNILYYAFHIRSALDQKIPLALYPVVHLFLLKCSPNPRLVNDTNHGFKQEEEETFLFLS